MKTHRNVFTQPALQLIAATALTVAPALADTQDATFPATAAAMYAHGQQRGADQMANPHYLEAATPHMLRFLDKTDQTSVFIDPYRLAWNRGTSVEVSFSNRYDAKLHARMFIPPVPFTDRVTGEQSYGPFPAIIMLSGSTLAEGVYRGLSQGLAEAGYVVLFVEAQGDGQSDVVPPDPSYCEPGDWQEPQEMGITENGTCAGKDPEPEGFGGLSFGGLSLEGFVSFLLLQPPYDEFAAHYHSVRARKTFAALDAIDWLLSQRNPHHALIDPERIGIAGHSLGAHAALLAGNGDPLSRFKAVVSFDGFGRLDDVEPRVPTMFQHADGQEVGPHLTPPDRDAQPGNLDSQRFRKAGVATMVVALAGSTHQEWNYIPFQLVYPTCPVLCFNSSRSGERVSLYYTQAWFDRWLKTGRKHRDDARQRLLARSFDRSVDESSIGQGTYDPVTRTNRPYRIEGEPVAANLSPFFRSSFAFDGMRCDDLRTGCPQEPLPLPLPELP